MASGIDTLAHRGALEAEGRTVAVFGCGVDVVYPSENKGLAKSIEENGSLVSEFPLGTGTEKGHFPRRNRIISGLSMGVIVVEGHYDSGAMITAKAALDQGREVFAVPGNVELDQSKGPHWLIKQGAKLVESVEDVLEEFNMVMPKRIENENRDYSNLPAEEQKIISVLSLEPKHIDNISVETKLSIPQVSSLLMMLEVKKLVRQLPGKMFVLY
jgi:DNA processing protein